MSTHAPASSGRSASIASRSSPASAGAPAGGHGHGRVAAAHHAGGADRGVLGIVDRVHEDAARLGGASDVAVHLGRRRGDREPGAGEVAAAERPAPQLGGVRRHLLADLGRDDRHPRAGLGELADADRGHRAAAHHEDVPPRSFTNRGSRGAVTGGLRRRGRERDARNVAILDGGRGSRQTDTTDARPAQRTTGAARIRSSGQRWTRDARQMGTITTHDPPLKRIRALTAPP